MHQPKEARKNSNDEFTLVRSKIPGIELLQNRAQSVVSKRSRWTAAPFFKARTYLALICILSGAGVAVAGAVYLTSPPQETEYFAPVTPFNETVKIPGEALGIDKDISYPAYYQIKGLTSPASTIYTSLGYGMISLGVSATALGLSFAPSFKLSDEDLMRAHIFLHVAGTVPRDSAVQQETVQNRESQERPWLRDPKDISDGAIPQLNEVASSDDETVAQEDPLVGEGEASTHQLPDRTAPDTQR